MIYTIELDISLDDEPSKPEPVQTDFMGVHLWNLVPFGLVVLLIGLLVNV